MGNIQAVSITWITNTAIPDLIERMKETDDIIDSATKEKEAMKLQMDAIEALEGSEVAKAALYGHVNIRMRIDHRLEEAKEQKKLHLKMMKSLITGRQQLTHFNRVNPRKKFINDAITETLEQALSNSCLLYTSPSPRD